MRQLQAQDQFLPLLVSATLLTTFALVLIAYLTVRADVLASQQQQVGRDVLIAREMLAGPGGGFALQGGRLVATSASGQAALTQNGAHLSRVRELTGERSALFVVHGTGLVAVAADGLGAVGQPPAPEAASALIGDCGPLAPSRCHQGYSGSIHLHDGEYTAAFVPLFDANGSFVGALGVAQPESVVLAPAAQFTVVLLFVGLLVTLVVLAAGVWTYNVLSGEVLDSLSLRLNHLATVAAELEHAANTQVVAARRQERMARQIGEGARDIDALVGSMNQGHLAMHDSATGIWAEMSQPGTAPDPATALRLARQAVVMAARIGVATEDARTRCNHVVRLMNQVIAEGHVLCGHGRETERRAAELRDVVEQIERAIGEPLAPAAPGASSPSASSSRLVALSQMPGFSSGFAPDVPAPREPTLHRVSQAVRAYARRMGRYLLERTAELAGRAGRVSALSQRRFGGRWPFASHQISREAAHDPDAAATTADEDYELPRLYDLPHRSDPSRMADGTDQSPPDQERWDNDTRPRW